MQDGTETKAEIPDQSDANSELDNQADEQEKEELMAVHVDPLTLLNNNTNIKPIIEDINMEEKEMETVQMPEANNYGVDNLIDFIDFIGTGYAITQKALSNDGKITKDEWINYAPLLLKIFPLITSITKVPMEFGDTITEEEEGKIIAKVKEAMSDVTDERIKEMIPEIMLILFDIQQFIKKYFSPTKPKA